MCIYNLIENFGAWNEVFQSFNLQTITSRQKQIVFCFISTRVTALMINHISNVSDQHEEERENGGNLENEWKKKLIEKIAEYRE